MDIQTEHQAEEVVLAAPVHDVGEGSSNRAAPQEDDGGPVDKSVLTTFKDHVAYAIWHKKLVIFQFMFTHKKLA